MNIKEKKMTVKQDGIIHVIDGPTWVEDMDALLAKYAKNVKQRKSPYLEIKDTLVIMDLRQALKKCVGVGKAVIYQGVEFDLTRLNDMRYFVKKAFQLINSQNTPTHSQAVQSRAYLIDWLEVCLNTRFQNTRDFRRKIGKYIQNYDARKLPASERLKKARKKLGWTQKELAKFLGYTSHVSIAQFEMGKRYPSKKVFQWLKEVGM